MPISALRRPGGEDDATAGTPVVHAVLLFGACLAAALALSMLGLRLLRDPSVHVSLWWPLSGFGVALLARLRARLWPVVLLALACGQFLANVSTYYGPLTAAGIQVATVGEVLLISVLLRRALPGGVVLDSPRAAFRFTLCAVTGVAFGAAVFALVQSVPAETSSFALWHGYLRSHALGLLMVSPLFLGSPDARGLLTGIRRHRLNLEWAAQFTVVGLVTAGVFSSDQRVVPAFICALPLIWGGLRLGPLRAMASLILMALIATTCTLHGFGPVVQDPPAAQTLAMQVVLASATLCTLFVVLAAEQKSALLELTRAGSADLVEAERIAGLGSSAIDLATGETRWSAGLYAQLGRDPGAVPPDPATYLAAIHPDDRDVVAAGLARVHESGQMPHMQFRLIRPDGTERTVLVRNRVDRDTAGRAAQLRSTVLDVTAIREAESALDQERKRLAGVLDAVQDVAIVGADARSMLITFFNRGAEQMLGWRADEVVGVHTPSIYHAPGDLERAMSDTGIEDPLLAIGDELTRTGHDSRRWTCLRQDGSLFQAQGSLTQILGPDGAVETYIAVIVDLTRVLRAEAELQESEDRFRLAFDFAPMAMAIVALDEGDPGRIVRANPALCRFANTTEPALVGRRLADLMTPAHADGAAADLRELLGTGGDSITSERAFHRGDGGELWGLLSTSVVRPAGREPYLITMIEDITARMQLTERLRHEASHDPLTGLPNRQVLRRRLEDALSQPPPHDAAVAVLYVDLDGFKGVNDSLGHAVGDELLVQVADRIAACVRSSDVVARLGGDEFAVLLPRVGYLETATAIGERIVEALAEPFEIDGSFCRIGASIGVAMSATDDSGSTVPQLLNAADEAMYEAKRAGKGRVEVSGR
ncbi:diguanylate cyclase [Kineosporia sp. J2-2]|uniref:Diguanylate cyclase n=1 Tax=Kineosporia corallincola TaxID=2835133 RepID=A0ABS5TNF1_9ACTN|nr:diguanylate cyclase [Kineosporia corallincola]MBT0771914.1 diguanylate cyclase [Kineosporia corallincola]